MQTRETCQYTVPPAISGERDESTVSSSAVQVVPSPLGRALAVFPYGWLANRPRGPMAGPSENVTS